MGTTGGVIEYLQDPCPGDHAGEEGAGQTRGSEWITSRTWTKA